MKVQIAVIHLSKFLNWANMHYFNFLNYLIILPCFLIPPSFSNAEILRESNNNSRPFTFTFFESKSVVFSPLKRSLSSHDDKLEDLHKILREIGLSSPQEDPIIPPPLPIPTCCEVKVKGRITFDCGKRKSEERRVSSFNKDPESESDYRQNEKLINRGFVKSIPYCLENTNNKYQYDTLIFNLTEIGEGGGDLEFEFTRDAYFGYQNEFYSPEAYCVNRLTGESLLEVGICKSKCGKDRPCIQKCCRRDEIYSFSQRRCIKSKNSVPFNPIFYYDMSNKVKEVGEEGQKIIPHFSIRFPASFKYHCQENITQIFPVGKQLAEFLSNSTGRKYHNADFRIRKDGTILYRKDGKAIFDNSNPILFHRANHRKCYTLKTEHYCIDGASTNEEGNFVNDENQMFLVTCSEHLYEPPIIGPLSFVYGQVMIGSSLFSLMTFFVYLILEEKRRHIHGLTVASYAASMFLMYVSLGMAHLFRYYASDEEVLKSKACVTIGIASHLFSLTSFFWLSVLNWELWWTFRKIRPTTLIKTGKNPKLWKTYFHYSLFGWGIPLMIVAFSSSLHFLYEEGSEQDCTDPRIPLPLPAYGRESCEIKQLSLGVYLYFPASFFLLCNLIFFIITIHSLCKHERSTSAWIQKKEENHQSVHLFGKLFFVMGVTRGFEVASWYESGPNLTWYWALLEIFNVLQAIAVFIIYVCKKDVINALRGKLVKKLK